MSFEILVTVLGIYSLKDSSRVDGLVVQLEPSVAEVMVGGNVTLTCRFDEPVQFSGWKTSQNGFLTSYVVERNGSCLTAGFLNASTVIAECKQNITYSITLLNVNNSWHNQSWVCSSGSLISNTSFIFVQVPIKTVSMTGPRNSVIVVPQLAEQQLVCETSEGRPPAIIKWYKTRDTESKERISVNYSISHVQEGDMYKSVSTLNFFPIKEDNGFLLFCGAINIEGQTELYSSRKKLNVTYPPDGPPVIQEGTSYSVIENNSAQLTCSISDGNPIPTLSWTCYNGRVFDNFTEGITTKVVVWTASRNQDNCTCFASHYAGTQSSSIRINVLHGASVVLFILNGADGNVTVKENDTVPIVCEVNSNPASNITLLRNAQTVLKGDTYATRLQYSLSAVTCSDAGQYTCMCSNQYNNEPSLRHAQLLVLCYPRPSPYISVQNKVQSALYQAAAFDFTAMAYPEPTPSQYTWYKEYKGVLIYLYNNPEIQISTEGLHSRLRIANVTQTSFGRYVLSVQNNIGSWRQIFSLEQISKPNRPLDLSYKEDESTETSFTILWIPGFDGGSMQTFILEYRKMGTQKWISLQVPDTEQTNNASIVYTVSNLPSGTQLEVRLFGRNAAGDSDLTEVIKAWTKDPTTMSQDNPAAVVGGTIGGFTGGAVTVAAAFVAVFLYRKFRTRTEEPRHELQENRANVYMDLKHTVDVTCPVVEYTGLDL